MWKLISVIFALGINFYIPESKKSMRMNGNNYDPRGFPYQYFEREVLTDEEVDYRLHLIYIDLMFGLSTSLPLGSTAAVMLQFPSSRPSIERIEGTESSSPFKNFLKIGPTVIKNSDKIVLTDKQIDQFDLLGQQVIGGSITIDKAIFQLRVGGITDVLVIMAFVIFINWLDEANAFQPFIPPHLNPMGYFQDSYQPKTGSPSKLPTSLKITRPSAMPHEEFVGLTKEEVIHHYGLDFGNLDTKFLTMVPFIVYHIV